MEPAYTFVIRSKDRVIGSTNDFLIRLPYIGKLADHTGNFRVGVVRCVFQKSTNYYNWHDSTSNDYVEPDGTAYIPSEFVELHLDFGGSCYGHDTGTGGARVVHFVNDDRGNRRHISGPTDAIYYDVTTPGLTEMRVRVINQFGKFAGQMQSNDYPNFTTDPVVDLSQEEESLNDFIFVMSVTPLNKNVSEY